MFQLLMFALATTAQENPPVFRRLDPPQGPTAGENRTLSQWHANQDLRTFPDLAVNELRIDEGTLYVRVANKGKARAKGPISITARAETNGVTSEAVAVRIDGLKGGESRWVPLTGFSVKTASAVASAPVFALGNASVVSAAIKLPPPSSTFDRSGQSCSRDCRQELDDSNNDFSANGSAIVRGRPE
jgi:hypothetical protein